MRKLKNVAEPSPAVAQVFEHWRKRQLRPDLCRLTNERRKLIEAALSDDGYEPKHLCSLVDYAYEAETAEARWWRGENPHGRWYVDLENLLVRRKLAPRVERAVPWAERRDQTEVRVGRAGVDLGPLGRVRMPHGEA